MTNAATKSGVWTRATVKAATMLIGLAGLANAAAAQTPGFWLVPNGTGERGNGASCLSADGRVLGGAYTPPEGRSKGFTWSLAGGRTAMPDTIEPTYDKFPQSLTGDGAVAVGSLEGVPDSQRDRKRIFRFRDGVYDDPVGVLPGFTRTQGGYVSRDGRAIAGWSERGFLGSLRASALLWTESGGQRDLGNLPGGIITEARAISGDGRVVVGTDDAGGGERAWVWREATGMVNLNPGNLAQALGVNHDGSFVVGSRRAGFDNEAVRWAIDGTATPLPGVLGWSSHRAGGVADDGSVIVGNANDRGTTRSWVWREGLGTMPAADYLRSFGLNVPEHSFILFAGVSADGRTVSGTLYRSSLDAQAFIATVPTPSSFALLALAGGLAMRRRR